MVIGLSFLLQFCSEQKINTYGIVCSDLIYIMNWLRLPETNWQNNDWAFYFVSLFLLILIEIAVSVGILNDTIMCSKLEPITIRDEANIFYGFAIFNIVLGGYYCVMKSIQGVVQCKTRRIHQEFLIGE